MRKDAIRIISTAIAKLVLAFICSYVGLVFLITSYAISSLFLSSLFPSYPNEREAKELAGTIFKYFLLEDMKLVYSIQHWNTMSYNICFVFHYPENYYIGDDTLYSYIDRHDNYNNNQFIDEFNREVPKEKGCANFIAELNRQDAALFKKYDYHHQYGRGGKVFLNEKERLIMFEGYLYD